MLPYIFFSLAFLCFIVISWKYIRPKFSVRVSCWFCGERTVVPYGNKNCWDCPSCEQYNGFDETGDYNKPIPAQYDDRLNHTVGCDRDEFISGEELLCNRCAQNQLLKVKQLANFVPFSEKNYDPEIEAFERHLEKVYQLCLSCQTRVQQELQIQNEALAKRFKRLNISIDSFSSTKKNSSFQMKSNHDWENNHRLKASLFLHVISLVCAVLLTLRKLQLDNQYNIVACLVYLYPVLVWLDKYAVTLVVTGLFVGLLAKLLLGKYRVHIIDAISCPIWLGVLLLQTDFIQVEQSWYDVIFCIANTLTSIVCLTINRERRNISKMHLRRLSLDPAGSHQGTTVSQFSSVSQPTRYSVSAKQTQHPLGKSHGQPHDESHDSLDDTLTDLDSISLGSPAAVKRTDSGIFSTAGQTNLQNHSVSQSLRQSRPLISPATFFSDSSTPPRNGNIKFGLFSTPQEQRQTSFTEQPLSGTSLNSRSFSVPKTTKFGSTPYSFSSEKPQFSGNSFFNIKLVNSQSSSLIGRQTPSERSFSEYRDCNSGRKRMIKKDLFTEKVDEEDKVSSISASTQCPVDSTTSSTLLKRNEPFWKHPGLIGFILGGSLVANILLLANYMWKDSIS